MNHPMLNKEIHYLGIRQLDISLFLCVMYIMKTPNINIFIFIKLKKKIFIILKNAQTVRYRYEIRCLQITYIDHPERFVRIY